MINIQKNKKYIDKQDKYIETQEQSNEVEQLNLYSFLDCIPWLKPKSSYFLWLSRLACMTLLFPIFFINYNFSIHKENIIKINNQTTIQEQQNVSHFGLQIASCLYLIVMPFASYVLQTFTYHHMEQSSKLLKCFSSFLSFFCIVLGNISAVCFLTISFKHYVVPFCILSLAFSLGCIQLLILLNKSSVVRVMVCTGTAVLVIILCVLAVHYSFSNNGKKFYQSASLPFLILYFETTKSHCQG